MEENQTNFSYQTGPLHHHSVAQPSTPEQSTKHITPLKNEHSPMNTPTRTSSLTELSTPHPITPRQSFYLENSVPISRGEAQMIRHVASEDAEATSNNDSVLETVNLRDELIFDDGDERLPPPVPSPTFHANMEPDALALSSPEMEKVNEDAFLPDDQLSPVFKENTFRSPSSGTPDISPSLFRGSSAYYPAPFPKQLMRPPKLRVASRSKRAHRDLSFNGFPEAPTWGSGINEREIEYYETPQLSQHGFETSPNDTRFASISTGYLTRGAGLRFNPEDDELDSDIESDKATIMSEDREDLEPVNNISEDSHTPASKKTYSKKKWKISRLFRRDTDERDLPQAKDEFGDKYDAGEAETLMAQMAVIDNDVAFTRLDPEIIQRHSQMFDAGGIYSGINPRKGATSLIEELEIRKAGKRVQYQVFSREAAELERQRIEDKDTSDHPSHPVDLINNIQPTLMQMQYMADADYKSRVDWHTRTINRDYINDHGNETLTQRRTRLKAERMAQKGQETHIEETLAQRRARLKREKHQSQVHVEA